MLTTVKRNKYNLVAVRGNKYIATTEKHSKIMDVFGLLIGLSLITLLLFI